MLPCVHQLRAAQQQPAMAGESQGYQHALCLRVTAIAAFVAAFITASAQQPQLSFNGRFVVNTNAAFPQVWCMVFSVSDASQLSASLCFHFCMLYIISLLGVSSCSDDTPGNGRVGGIACPIVTY